MMKNVDENKRILDAQEKERQRISRELHDYSLQKLTHLIHKVELSSMYIDKDTIQAKLELETVNNSLRGIIQEMRNIIFDLRPMSFDDLGFAEAMERLRINLERESKLKIIFSIDKLPIEDTLILISIFRIVRECSFNAMKHSQGESLKVVIKSMDDKIYICIEDDGKGYDMESVNNENTHFGLSIVKERVSLLCGSIKVDSGSKGTRIIIEIPTITEKNEGKF